MERRCDHGSFLQAFVNIFLLVFGSLVEGHQVGICSLFFFGAKNQGARFVCVTWNLAMMASGMDCKPKLSTIVMSCVQ